MRDVVRAAAMAAIGAVVLGSAGVGAAVAADIPVAPRVQQAPEYYGEREYAPAYVYRQPAPVYVYPADPYYVLPPVAVLPAPYYRRHYGYVVRGPVYRPYLARGYGRWHGGRHRW